MSLFIDYDSNKFLDEIIAAYENITGRKLMPADPERLLIDAIIYLFAIHTNNIEYTGKQNLVQYASGKFLEEIGKLLGVVRSPAKKAITTLQFTLDISKNVNTYIPQGTRVAAGEYVFSTTQEAVIPAGQLSVDVVAECETAGSSANGFAIGQINQLLDYIDGVYEARNITMSMYGADEEDDESFRKRIILAPEKLSNAGTKYAYIFHVFAYSPEIIDVCVTSPSPGVVNISCILKDGEIPSAEFNSELQEYISSEKIRALTDTVTVIPVEVINYSIDIEYKILKEHASLTTRIADDITNAVNEFIEETKSKIGKNVLPEQLYHKIMSVQGVYEANIVDPSKIYLTDHQLAVCSSININYAGLSDD